MIAKRALFRCAALAAITVAATSVRLSAQTNAQWPSILEAKNIAEEGFIYGLPIVMNYAVMYEYSVDRNSGQYAMYMRLYWPKEAALEGKWASPPLRRTV